MFAHLFSLFFSLSPAQLSTPAAAPREARSHARWRAEKELRRKTPARVLYGDALGDARGAERGAALSASQVYGATAKGAAPRTRATRWGGAEVEGAAARVVEQHLEVAMGSLPGGRWTSREARFDPGNPLFPEVCQVKGMHMGVPLRSKVSGPSGFFGVARRDPASIGAAVARAKALAERNAARNADANAAARDAPLMLDADGVLREQAPAKVPFVGSSAPRMGSVEFYRSGDVRFLLCTVTFHANHAHNLARSP